MQKIFRETLEAAYQIIERKGATYYAVAYGLLRIVEAILRDQSTVLSVSSLQQEYLGISDVCLSVPTVIDRSGVHRVVKLDLSPDELEGLKHSASVLKESISGLELPSVEGSRR